MSVEPFTGIDGQPAFEIVEATREAIPAQIALWGAPDSGKTYSALLLARGLVGPEGKIVIIDAEHKRAKFYSGLFGGFFHLNLLPPFSPERYMGAHKAALAAAADAIIVDSASHVWGGEGGVLAQVDASKEPNAIDRWKSPKAAYNAMVSSMLRSPVHMIYCLREKERFVQPAPGRPAEIVSAGFSPICDPLFIHEMMISARLEAGTHKPLFPIKIPDAIMTAIKPGELITEKTGRFIGDWISSGAPIDQEKEALHEDCRAVASQGTAVFCQWWKKLTKQQREVCKGILPELQGLTRQADTEMLRSMDDATESLSGTSPFDDAFTKGSAA